MTWLGKILAFVVMIAAVVWMYFNAVAYKNSTNWKTAYDKLKVEYEKDLASRNAEANRFKTSEESLRRLYVDEFTRGNNLQKDVDSLSKANSAVVASVKDLQGVISDGDVKSVLAQANVEVMIKELDTIRGRNSFLEDRTSQLVIDSENSKREMVRAQNALKLSLAISDDYAKKVEELQAQMTDLKSGGSDLRRLMQKSAPPVLPNLRGEVELVRGDMVVLSIGVDAGLSKGSVLDISRLEGGGRYLGTVKVMDLDSKQAVAEFRPARTNVPFSQLRPEELPKKGDLVRPPESVSGR